jgi:hypothetical protein
LARETRVEDQGGEGRRKISVNVTRFHGSGLDERDLTRAEIEIRKQAYYAFEFLQPYVGGFRDAIFLEVAPKLGIRETRRVRGEHVLTEAEVRGQARFDDAIGLCNSPVDVHEPGGSRAIMDNVGEGYGIPFRCLVPLGGCLSRVAAFRWTRWLSAPSATFRPAL